PNPAVVERSETNARPSAARVASMYAKNQNVPREASHIPVESGPGGFAIRAQRGSESCGG
ncbi:MAG: hypothetical protein WCI96_09245, partial [Planctomycetota bacterium]